MMWRIVTFVCLSQPVFIEEENLSIKETTREVSTHISMQLAVISILTVCGGVRLCIFQFRMSLRHNPFRSLALVYLNVSGLI